MEQFEINRDRKMDVAKGILIALVVYGHSGFDSSFVNLFHMAVFIMISGFFYKGPDIRTWKEYVFRRIKFLWVPYVLSNCGFTLFCYIGDKFKWSIIQVENLNEIFFSKGLLTRIITEVCMLNTGPYATFTWFIKNLFAVSILVYAVDWAIIKLNIYRKIELQAVIAVAMLIIGFVGYKKLPWIPAFYNIERVLVSYILFYSGYMIHNLQIKVNTVTKLISLAISTMGLCLLNSIGNVWLVRVEITNPLFFMAASALGWVMIVELSTFVEMYTKFLPQVLSYMGKKSIYILCLHGFVGSICSYYALGRWLTLVMGCFAPILFAYVIDVIRVARKRWAEWFLV